MNRLPYLLPWVRVLLLIRSITSTTWGHEAWPQVKPVRCRALSPLFDHGPKKIAGDRSKADQILALVSRELKKAYQGLDVRIDSTGRFIYTGRNEKVMAVSLSELDFSAGVKSRSRGLSTSYSAID